MAVRALAQVRLVAVLLSAAFAIGGCRFESRPGLLRTKVYSAFPSLRGR